MKRAIAWMAQNGVAANLLMLFILVAGLLSATSITQKVFPEFSLEAVQVRVPYPGASPQEVEDAIVQRIEERIEAVEGIKQVTSVAAQNVGVVTAELKLGTDVSQALDEIKGEIDRIVAFPQEAEEPIVRELTNRTQALQLALYGDASERTLKELAYRVEEELTATAPISFVQVSGVRDYEISIEVPRDALRAYNLTLGDIARVVQQSSLDLPGGSVETSEQEVLVRTQGQNYTRQDYARILLLGQPDGSHVRLGQIAEIEDGFTDSDLTTRFNGQPAAFVQVYRTADEQVLKVVDEVMRYLDEELRPTLPRGIEVAVWQNEAESLRSRLSLLVKNGLIGLALVILALTLFLNIRLAFWTSVGIFIAFVGTFVVMQLLGISINLISLFGFILAIGIVVDDAIVAGENIFAERERGRPPLEASVRGAQRIAAPVTFAVLTTVTAFSPLLFVPGTIGKILKDIPTIVITVLLLSLVEALFILPNHLTHLRTDPPQNRVGRFFDRLQQAVDRRLKAFVDGPLERAVRFAVRRSGWTIAGGVALILLMVGLVVGGYVKFSFLPRIEGELVTAQLELPEGTAVGQTQRVADYLTEQGRRTAEALQETLPEEHPDIVQNVYTSVGQQVQEGGPGAGATNLAQPSVATVQFELIDPERRDLSSKRFEEQWRERVGTLPTVRALSFSSNVIEIGKPVQVELSAAEEDNLDRAVERLMDELRRFGGVFDVQSDQARGKREVQLQLKPTARLLGLTLADVAGQVRAAFFGAEALRVQRGREEVRVYVRLPERERSAIADIEAYRIRTPGGGRVPLEEVAEVTLGYGPAQINRRDGRRVVTVTADVNPAVVTGQAVSGELRSRILPELQQAIPGVRYSFGGEQEQQAEALGAMARGFAVALFVMYALLAIPFRSYAQPLVIMAAIPFGIIGAILGHLLLGINLGILSIFGIVGLSGVVVNDSLVMIDFINEERRGAASLPDSIVRGAQSRFRPILLTSVTTFLGVFPLIIEQSVQAQFLIPLAVSLGFGILFATVIIMLIVPALCKVQFDASAWLQRRVLGRDEDAIEMVSERPEAAPPADSPRQ